MRKFEQERRETGNTGRQARQRSEQFLSGTIPKAEMEELWVDWVEDPDLFEKVKTEANVRDLIRNQGRLRKIRGGSSEGREGAGPYRSWMLAAAILLIAWVGYQWSTPGTDVGTAVQPLTSIELEIYRSAEPVEENNTIREAVTLASRGEHQAAVQLIDQALLQVQDRELRALLSLNAGSILYNMSRFEEARSRFMQVLELGAEDPMVRERAFWYLGNTYFQMNDLARAREAFRQTLEMNGAYRRVAERYLNALSA